MPLRVVTGMAHPVISKMDYGVVVQVPGLKPSRTSPAPQGAPALQSETQGEVSADADAPCGAGHVR